MNMQNFNLEDFLRIEAKLRANFDGVEDKHIWYAYGIVRAGYPDWWAIHKVYWVYGEGR